MSIHPASRYPVLEHGRLWRNFQARISLESFFSVIDLRKYREKKTQAGLLDPERMADCIDPVCIAGPRGHAVTCCKRRDRFAADAAQDVGLPVQAQRHLAFGRRSAGAPAAETGLPAKTGCRRHCRAVHRTGSNKKQRDWPSLSGEVRQQAARANRYVVFRRAGCVARAFPHASGFAQVVVCLPMSRTPASPGLRRRTSVFFTADQSVLRPIQIIFCVPTSCLPALVLTEIFPRLEVHCVCPENLVCLHSCSFL